MFRVLLIFFVASVVASALMTRYVRDFARVRGWVDQPDWNRHLHSRPVPRLGGVALFVTVASMTLAGLCAMSWMGLEGLFSVKTVGLIIGSAGLIFLMGLYDDFRGVGPYVKFGVQVLAACLLYLRGLGIHQFDLLLRDSQLKGIVGLPLTIIWVLLITNAFNLIDGLDGLAAGAGLFSTVVLFLFSGLTGNHLVTFLAIILAGAIVGFLRFNFNPATIFLGDSGSLFIGFMLSVLGLAGSQKAPTMIAVAIPVVCFGLPILDVAIAVVRRFLSGKPLFEGDSEHIHHRLLNRGFSHRHAVLILYAVSAFFGLLSLGLLHGGGIAALVLVILGIGVCVGIPQLRYHEFKEVGRFLERTASQKQIIENDLHIRRATEALYNCDDLSEIGRVLSAALQPIGFDGFRLSLPSTVLLPPSVPVARKWDSGEELSFSWTLPDSAIANFELSLTLVNSSGERCGVFSVYKQLIGRPLWMDVNLLGEGFHIALANAVHRAIEKHQGIESDFRHEVPTGRSIPSQPPVQQGFVVSTISR